MTLPSSVLLNPPSLGSENGNTDHDLTTYELTVEQIIELLGLTPHPEGGWFVETFRDQPPKARPETEIEPSKEDKRGASTAIYFLLAAGQFSHWHRVDAAEAWHWYAGAPLQLDISLDGRHIDSSCRLGADLLRGDRPQAVVPPNAWQSARSLGAWTLVGCTVAPAFLFSGFEMAPPGWFPGFSSPS
jgi:predicted cupin superfamily sugar epimerase